MCARCVPFALLGLAVAACSGPSAPTQPILVVPTFEARPAAVVAGTLSVVLVTRNTEPHAIMFDLRRPCGGAVNVYDASELVWDGWSWLHSPPGGCKGIDHAVVLEPGDSLIAGGVAPVAAILGDSLASRTYSVSASIILGPPARRLELFAPGLVLLSAN